MEELPKKRKTEEASLQTKVMKYLRHEQTAYICALTNDPVAPDAGYPDVTCVSPTGQFVGIELKAKKGKQSVKQKKWQEEIEKRGGKYLIIKTVDNFPL